MEVAYWELAPYLPGIAATDLEKMKVSFIQNNAGKAFEHMIEAADAERAALGLPDVETAHQAPLTGLDDQAISVIDAARARFQLPSLAEARATYPSLLVMQKEETVTSLGKIAMPNPGCVDMLEKLQEMNVPFNIATTSGKPRVPACVDAANGLLRKYFPTDEKIHSGESDFDPPRFKPAPDVYLKAAAAEGMEPSHCIAVEDSASGVGSASNAKMGLIVGYVGGSHIPDSKKQSHAEMLMEGTRADDGRGAEIVISDLRDLCPIVDAFNQHMSTGEPLVFPDPATLKGTTYLPKVVPFAEPKQANVCVLFDFDGTLGDTETPAMEVAYWELAPYLPGIAATDLEKMKVSFIQNNAGKAFEHMIEAADAERAALGLPDVETAHQAPLTGLDDQAISVIDAARARFQLPSLAEARATYPSLLVMQKEETVTSLGKIAMPNPGCVDMLEKLQEMNVPFNIATTSGKPRVPACVDAANGLLRKYFPTDEKIHSGESDFDPPRFKPAPDVYLKAAAAEGMEPSHCIAVEDSASGVGSASNAKMGLIVGYVGGSHIPDSKKQSHAEMLMEGTRADDGRGAEIVISDLRDLCPIVDAFDQHMSTGEPLVFPDPTKLKGTTYPNGPTIIIEGVVAPNEAIAPA